jgi:hypothetical protein
MITPTQPRTIEVECSNGVTGYFFECPDGHWETRYCTRPFRGGERKELPENLRGAFRSADEAKGSLARHYKTALCSSRQYPNQ